MPQPQRLDQIADFLVGAHLVDTRRRDVEDLAAQRQDRLGFAVAALLGRAAGRVALDQKQFRSLGDTARTIGQLARQAQALGGALARQLLALLAARAILGALDHSLQQRLGAGGVGRQPMIEMILYRVLDQAGRFGAGQLLLGLSLELRFADETGHQQARAAGQILGRNSRGAAVIDHLAIVPQAADQGRTQAGFVGSTPRESGWCCNRNCKSLPHPRARPPPIRPIPYRRGRRPGRQKIVRQTPRGHPTSNQESHSSHWETSIFPVVA